MEWGSNLTQDNQNTAAPWSFPVGLFIGVTVLSILRILYYSVMGLELNTHPVLALLLIPVLYLLVLLVLWPVEILVRKYWHHPTGTSLSMVVGIAYSTLLLFWVIPEHAYIWYGVNPVSLRVILGFSAKKKASR